MREEFVHSIDAHRASFGLDLTDEHVERLADLYDLIQEHNALLHLVGPCSPEEFAIRHILESLTLLDHLPTGAKFADVGAGAGLPSMPCLIVRDDLKAVLIESKEKKVRFLRSAVDALGLQSRTTIADRQFEEVDPADCRFVTCRALDKFTEKLPRLVKWSGSRTMLLFGGRGLGEALQKLKLPISARLLPMSDARFLFVVGKGSSSPHPTE